MSAQLFNINGISFYIGAGVASFTGPIDPSGGAILDISNPDLPAVSPVSPDQFMQCAADETLMKPFSNVHLWAKGIVGTYDQSRVYGNEFTLFAYPGQFSYQKGSVVTLGLDESRAQIKTTRGNKNASAIFFDESLHTYARCEFAIENTYVGCESESFNDRFDVFGHLMNRYPELRERAVEVHSEAVAIFRDFDFSGQRTLHFNYLKALCNLDFDIISDREEGNFITVGVTKKRSMGDLVSSLLKRREVSQMFRSVDIGAGTCLVPFYMQSVLRNLDPSIAMQALGTELSRMWNSDWITPAGVKRDMFQLGLQMFGDSRNEERAGTFLHLSSYLPQRRFDLVTWVRPFLTDDNYTDGNEIVIDMLPNNLSENAMIVVVPTIKEYEFSWNIVGKICKALERQGIDYGLNLVVLENGLKNFDPDLPYEQNISAGNVVDSRQILPSKKIFVFSVGDRGMVNPSGSRPMVHASWKSAFCDGVERNIAKSNDPIAQKLLRRSLGIISR